MNKEHKEQLENILRWYGSAKTIEVIADITEQECKTTYADNKGAIIHNRLPIIKEASNKLNNQLMGRLTGVL